MNTRDAILNTVTGLTGLCAAVLTIHALRQPSVAAAAGSFAPHAVAEAQWKPLLASGHRIGPADAKLTMIEFADFQCPVCGAYEAVIDSMRVRHPHDFAVVFHHSPLPYHPLAMPLARASECAAAQGRFEAFHDSVFADQHKLGLVTIADFAKRAGVQNLALFNTCAADTIAVPSITSDLAAAKKLNIPGTPAIIVGGMLHTADLSVHELEELLSHESK